MTQDHNSEFVKWIVNLGLLCLSCFTTSMYNVIMGNILVTLSIIYLVWRWRRDYRKNKKEENENA